MPPACIFPAGQPVNDRAPAQSAGDNEVRGAAGSLRQRRMEAGDAGDVGGQIAGGAEDGGIVVGFDKNGGGISAFAKNKGVRTGGIGQSELGASRPARPEQCGQQQEEEDRAK